jgi:hypothetical protein
MREAVSISAQLQMQTKQLQALGQAVVQANTRPPAMLADKYAPLLEQVLLLCKVAAEPELANFWTLVPNIKIGLLPFGCCRITSVPDCKFRDSFLHGTDYVTCLD